MSRAEYLISFVISRLGVLIIELVVVLGFVAITLAQRWRAVAAEPLDVHVHWASIMTASVVVLLAYGVLIETWRVMLRSWGDTLDRMSAARIRRKKLRTGSHSTSACGRARMGSQ